MRKIYCGGSFDFDYLRENYREEAAKDYRATLLGGADKLLQRGEAVRINETTEYIGPFYFETDGMQDVDIVRSEWEMVKNCTDAIFLLDGAACPGTICEMTSASMLGKRVHIFYVRKSGKEETESELRTPCWYPIIHSLAINPHAQAYACESRDDAVGKILATVRAWQESR